MIKDILLKNYKDEILWDIPVTQWVTSFPQMALWIYREMQARGVAPVLDIKAIEEAMLVGLWAEFYPAQGEVFRKVKHISKETVKELSDIGNALGEYRILSEEPLFNVSLLGALYLYVRYAIMGTTPKANVNRTLAEQEWSPVLNHLKEKYKLV